MNKRNKDWIEFVANQRCIVTGHSQIQVHHVIGRTAIHNKIPIGHIWILPLWFILHDVNSNHPSNVTHYPNNFEKEFGSQKELFNRLLGRIYPFYGLKKWYPTYEEVNAIQDYSK